MSAGTALTDVAMTMPVVKEGRPEGSLNDYTVVIENVSATLDNIYEAAL